LVLAAVSCCNLPADGLFWVKRLWPGQKNWLFPAISHYNCKMGQMFDGQDFYVKVFMF
jgi:hypothetical protein